MMAQMRSKSSPSFGPKKSPQRTLRFAKKKEDKILVEGEYFCDCEQIDIKPVKAKSKKIIETNPVEPKQIIDVKPVQARPKQTIEVRPVQSKPKKSVEVKPIKTVPKQCKDYIRWYCCGQQSKDNLEEDYYVKKEIKKKPVPTSKPIKEEEKFVRKEEKKLMKKEEKEPAKKEENKAPVAPPKLAKRKEKPKPPKIVPKLAKTQEDFQMNCRNCIRWFKSLNKASATTPKFIKKKGKPEDPNYMPRIINDQRKAEKTKRTTTQLRLVKKQQKPKANNTEDLKPSNVKYKRRAEEIERSTDAPTKIPKKQTKPLEDFNPRVLKYRKKVEKTERSEKAAETPPSVVRKLKKSQFNNQEDYTPRILKYRRKVEKDERLKRASETSPRVDKRPADKSHVYNSLDYEPGIFLNYKSKSQKIAAKKLDKSPDIKSVESNSSDQKRKSNIEKIFETFNVRTSYDLRSSSLKPLGQNNKRRFQNRLSSGDSTEHISSHKTHSHKIPLIKSTEYFPYIHYNSKSSNKATQTKENKKVSFKSEESFTWLPRIHKILTPLIKNSLKRSPMRGRKSNSSGIETLIKAYLKNPNPYRNSKTNSTRYSKNYESPEQYLGYNKAETFAIYSKDMEPPTTYHRCRHYNDEKISRNCFGDDSNIFKVDESRRFR